MMVQAWCREVPSRWRSSDRVAIRGRVGFRRRWSRRRAGLDKILVARELARLVASSARLDSARFNIITS
jgi:hypothetical protein